MTASGVFIAGTDTGIGKTFASVALLHALRARGLKACGYKPVASGSEQTSAGRRNEDALALLAASSRPLEYQDVNPIAFSAPVSPHLAAADEGRRVDMAIIREGYEHLARRFEAVVVEGVGGWMAPLALDLPASELAKALDLPVVLVVGMRLGCLNHALLSARAIQADGCRLAGWIGNLCDPTMLRVEDNLATLAELLPAPCLGRIDHGANPAAAAGNLAVAATSLVRAGLAPAPAGR